MCVMKTINVFSSGDANDPATWSNIPYCLVRQLEKRGFRCNCFDVSLASFGKIIYWISCVWYSIMRRVHEFLHPGTQFLYTFERTPFFCWLVEKRISRLLTSHADAILNIVFSFSFLAKSSNIPCMLFCDWSYEFLIRYRHGRMPFFLERGFIAHERRVMKAADYVVSLFEEAAEAQMELQNDIKVQYYNKNVVNNLNDKELMPANAAIALKKSSHRLLFIGRKHYINAAKQLVRVAFELTKRYDDFVVDIIGLNYSDFDDVLPKCICCHGFLNKGDEAQRRLYYDLLERATCFVNSSPEWGGYSSTIETMYYYTPIVIAPYKQFQLEFGNYIDFGVYVENQSDEALLYAVEKVMRCPDYEKCAFSSHVAVRDYSWENFSRWLLEKVVKL